MDSVELTGKVDDVAGRYAPTVLRWTAALLWLANVNWKVPPDFGRSGDRCVALCRYVEAGADHPVLPGSAWLFGSILSPNLTAFGWVTIVSEVAIVVLLVSGRYVRSAAALGIVMSFTIGLAVANAPDEWYWSYALMMALHVAVLVTAPMEKPQSARTMAGITVGYGVAVAIAHGGAGFTGSGSWLLFGQDNDVPGEWGRGTFPGSLAIGLVFVVVGGAAWFFAGGSGAPRRRVLGWLLVVIAGLLTCTYSSGGLVLGLGSRPGNTAILAALGLAFAVTPSIGAHHVDR